MGSNASNVNSFITNAFLNTNSSIRKNICNLIRTLMRSLTFALNVGVDQIDLLTHLIVVCDTTFILPSIIKVNLTLFAFAN
jgi:hypothetical protein